MFGFKKQLLTSKRATQQGLLHYLDSFNNPKGQETLSLMIQHDMSLLDYVEDLPQEFLAAIKKNGESITTESVLQQITDKRYPYLFSLVNNTKGRFWIAKQVREIKNYAKVNS